MVAGNNGNTKVKKTLLAGVAALFLATGTAHAVGVDYFCGDTYSIVVEPKDRTINVFEQGTFHHTEFVPKGITVHNDKSGIKWTVKRVPRKVGGKTCKKVRQ
jgi:hypothetical protein